MHEIYPLFLKDFKQNVCLSANVDKSTQYHVNLMKYILRFVACEWTENMTLSYNCLSFTYIIFFLF